MFVNCVCELNSVKVRSYSLNKHFPKKTFLSSEKKSAPKIHFRFFCNKKRKKNDGGNEKNEKFSRNRIKHKDDNKEKNRNNKF